MAHRNMQDTTLSSATQKRHKPGQPQRELQAYSHNAYRVLGPNYLTMKWLPAKGPYFYAFVQALRSHIYWDYSTGIQRSALFPSAETLAKQCKIHRAKVFDLLNDPDMQLFVRRINRRRYDAASQKEVQTSNAYYVAMDDPPLPPHLQRELEPGIKDEDLDEVKVRQEQVRILLIEAGQDPEDRSYANLFSHALTCDSSESFLATLKGVVFSDSQRCRPERHEDHISNSQSLGEDRSITETSKGGTLPIVKVPINPVAAGTIGKGQRRGTDREEAAQHDEIETRSRSESADTPPVAAAPPSVPVLSESEAWKAEAHGWLEATRLPARPGEAKGPTILAHHMNQFHVENAPAATEAIITSAAPQFSAKQIPAETLADLAEQARRRANLYVHKIDPQTGERKTTNPGGYYLNILHTLIAEYGKRKNLELLEKKTQQMETKEAAAERVIKGQPASGMKARTAGARYPNHRPDAWKEQRGASQDEIRMSLYGR